MFDIGYNVPKKRRAYGVIGHKHRVTKDESMKWFQQKVCSLLFSVESLFSFVVYFIHCILKDLYNQFFLY